jgi:RHS repeat-associated protein
LIESVYYTQGLLSQRRNNASYFYHYDGLGSTKALTDANQNVQSSTKYDAWGNILQASGTITNPYLYVGELGYYGDGDAGMYLLTQRWYNPAVGRFVVRDPANEEDNDYTYVGNLPTFYVDKSGLLKSKWCCWKWKDKHKKPHCFGFCCHGDPECPPKKKKCENSDESCKVSAEVFKGMFSQILDLLNKQDLAGAMKILDRLLAGCKAPEVAKTCMEGLYDSIRVHSGPNVFLNCFNCCYDIGQLVGLEGWAEIICTNACSSNMPIP